MRASKKYSSYYGNNSKSNYIKMITEILVNRGLIFVKNNFGFG